MSLKRNVIASYASQAYVTLIGLVMIPLYLQYMGLEAYGLVGFFAMMQSLFQLLDMGLTPSMSRETARYLGGATSAQHIARLMRALEGIFLAVGLVGCGAIALGAELVATKWLKVGALPLDQVHGSILLMGLIVGLRWMGGLYRGAISGFERLVWLSGFNVVAASARFVLVIPYFILVGSTPIDFFGYQLGVALLELAILVVLTYRLMPSAKVGISGAWNWKPVSHVLKFSLSVAFTSSAWVLITQTDKLLLSKILSLADYAYFSLAVLMASGVFILSGPISAVLLPRLTRLNASGDNDGVIRIYREATQIIAWLAMSAAIVLAFFSERTLWAWTGNEVAAHAAAPVLALYALGNGILALSAFPYYLQFAKGDMRLHIQGNIIFVVILAPLLILAASHYGSIGAGYAWLTANLVYFAAWVPRVHKRFANGMHVLWLGQDIAPTVFLAAAATLIAKLSLTWPETRLATGVEIAALSMVVLMVGSFGVAPIRNRYTSFLASARAFSRKKNRIE